MSKFDEIRKKARQKANGEEDLTEDLATEMTEETIEESSVVEDAPMEEAEVVPDENVENLAENEEGGEDATLPQSPDGDSSLEEGANVDVEAVIAENKALQEEVKNLREALEQSGQLAKEGALAVAVGEDDDVDFSAFVYGDEGARKDTSKKLFSQLLGALRTEAAPILAERDEAKRALDVQKAIKLLSSMEDDFPGYGGKSDAIEALIGRDDILASYADPVKQRIAAYIMNAGLEAIEKGKTGMSVDELMELYRKNEEFKTAVEKERLQLFEETGNIPVIPMDGGGLSTAAPYEAPEPPKSVKEATERAKKKWL